MPSRIEAAMLTVVAALMLAGCADTGTRTPAARPARAGAAADTPVRIGQPYIVAGRSYVPADDRGYDQVGLASIYGEGGRTASGERYEPGAVSAAHPTLPLPSYVEVTALATGRTILVRVNDRGPFARGRIIDLSARAARELGQTDGVLRVRVRRAFPSEADRALLRSGQPAAPRLPATPQLLAALNARLDGTLGQHLRPLPKLAAASRPVEMEAAATPDPLPTGEADTDPTSASIAALPSPPPDPPRKSRSKPASKPGPTPRPVATPATGLFVQLGAFADHARAESVARAARGRAAFAGSMWRVRVGPFPNRATATEALARARSRGYPDAALVRDPATP